MGPANSAQVHFSSQQLRAEQKTKKRRRGKRRTNTQTPQSLESKWVLSVVPLSNFYEWLWSAVAKSNFQSHFCNFQSLSSAIVNNDELAVK